MTHPAGDPVPDPGTAELSPVEAVVLAAPSGPVAEDTLRVALGDLVARKLVVVEQVGRGLFGSREFRLAQTDAPGLPPLVAAVHLVVAPPSRTRHRLTAEELATRLIRAFGPDLSRYQELHVLQALESRGLVRREEHRVLGIIRRERPRSTPAGEAALRPVAPIVETAGDLAELATWDARSAAETLVGFGSWALANPRFYHRIDELARRLRELPGPLQPWPALRTPLGSERWHAADGAELARILDGASAMHTLLRRTQETD